MIFWEFKQIMATTIKSFHYRLVDQLFSVKHSKSANCNFPKLSKQSVLFNQKGKGKEVSFSVTGKEDKI